MTAKESPKEPMESLTTRIARGETTARAVAESVE
jgi:hypothetical protein